MSEDHKPEDPAERARIEKAGGSVTLDGRVNGGLNLSRALGDHAYKKTITLPHTEQVCKTLKYYFTKINLKPCLSNLSLITTSTK
jgi:protein phosphatase 1G